MPIGIVSDEDLLVELGRNQGKKSTRKTPSQADVPREEVIRENSESIPENEVRPTVARRGRQAGDMNVPESLRKLIAEEALLNGRQAALLLASDFGVSPSSASAYAVGATSTTSYNQPAKSLITHINKSRERAVKRASKTLNQALGSITQEKLDFADVKDLAGIAKDMSVIIKNLEPKESTESASAMSPPQFVIYAPQFKREEVFDTIVVNE